jgi:predicted anti-sigma-YlaC factor YlaD
VAKTVRGTVDSLKISAAQDEDPEFVRDALPLGLKLLEASLMKSPKNKDLLLSACSGFATYAQAFIVQEADFLENDDLSESRRQRKRAGRMFVRARGYCLRALEERYKGLPGRLNQESADALTQVRKKKDVPLLYWTGTSWAAAINVSRSNYDLVVDLAVSHHILKRALALDPGWDEGALHEVLITVESARAPHGGSMEQAREHFRRAMEISRGKKIGPLVSVAESISVKEQNYAEFRKLLDQALAFDLDSAPDYRLANTLAQRRARWLLKNEEDLFVEVGP